MSKQRQWNPFDNPLFEDDEEPEQLPPEVIPKDPQEFYEWVGYITHPRTGEPVKKLTWWQYDVWKAGQTYKRRLEIKSQKVGGSFSALDEDFQHALLDCRGKDILVIAQTQGHADEHILKLKTRIINSDNARKYLITEPSEFLFKEQKTKVKVATIKNPDNFRKPTRIIALGMSESSMWSWSNVGHIHMSDPTVADIKDDAPIFAAVFSRLASTDGSLLIETPPRGPRGKTFEIYNQYLIKQQSLTERDFKIFHVTAEDAVKEGLITRGFLDEAKAELGALYPQYYGAKFIAVSGNLFSHDAIDKAITKYDVTNYRPNSEKYITADQGYITSKFAVIVGEWEPKLRKIRVLKAEEIQSPQFEQMRDRILRYRREYGNVMNIGIDATSRMEFAMSLKTKIGENADAEYIKKKMAEYKANRWDINKAMHVVPIFFNLETKAYMAAHARQLLEDPRELIAIDESFTDLIVAIRSAVFDERGQLDKEMSPHNDLLEAWLMFLTFFKLRKKE